jgi:3-oxoacyl-(acyl-carrier-protein) synthase
MSGTKSMTGLLLGAAGAIESIISIFFYKAQYYTSYHQYRKY